MGRKSHLIIIDPQNSFCKVVPPNEQQVIHDGELCVPGAWDDMCRVGQMIARLGRKLDDISVTMDSHQRFHIAHGVWFKDRNGNHPNPFTLMREDRGRIINYSMDANGTITDLGEYTTFVPNALPWTLHYLKELVARQRYLHCIWTEHCLIGTPGHNIVPSLRNALLDWESLTNQTTNFVTKGSHPCVEHFSAVQAEVPFDGDAHMGLKSDPSTQLNAEFIQSAMEADEILAAGEAGSHCLPNTFWDMAHTFPTDPQTGRNPFLEKVVLLTNATSPVPGFEFLQNSFIQKATALGMKTCTCEDYLA